MGDSFKCSHIESPVMSGTNEKDSAKINGKCNMKFFFFQTRCILEKINFQNWILNLQKRKNINFLFQRRLVPLLFD